MSRSGLPEPLDRLGHEILRVLTPDLLQPKWAALAEELNNSLVGHCVNASGAFWYLLGGSGSGWRWRNLPERVWPQGGPHYWLEHEPTGFRVDLTAGQFAPSLRIPYEKAEGRAPATRGRDKQGRALPPLGAREVVRRVLSTKHGRDAVAAARKWSELHV